MRGNSHVRCKVGESLEIVSNCYLSLTAATLLYKHGGVDIRVLKDILGHENISATQIYAHVDEEQLREAVKLNPLADFTKK